MRSTRPLFSEDDDLMPLPTIESSTLFKSKPNAKHHSKSHSKRRSKSALFNSLYIDAEIRDAKQNEERSKYYKNNFKFKPVHPKSKQREEYSNKISRSRPQDIEYHERLLNYKNQIEQKLQNKRQE